jgi:hypothetical protein
MIPILSSYSSNISFTFCGFKFSKNKTMPTKAFIETSLPEFLK